jgi:5-methylcytosine-specific restriction endonuclease McrBC GTP-binding regulatory subunit McrB
MRSTWLYGFPQNGLRGSEHSPFDILAGEILPAIPKNGEVLLMIRANDSFEGIQPVSYTADAVQGQSLSLIPARVFNHPVTYDTATARLMRPITSGFSQITPAQYDELLSLMGGERVSETDLITLIENYISARGYYFDPETIRNYHTCLKTRPFVILAGLSGTGKSKLPQLYAEALGHNVQNGHYLRLPVRPSWNDDRFLLGYLNTITGEYITEPGIEFVINAERDRENLYFFGLDEMNLAHVEYYFSQFLSAMEEESVADRRIHLFSESAEKRLRQQGSSLEVKRTVIVPDNLLFTGTINVDETTQPISEKVIDRANTIEFFEVDLDKIPEKRPIPETFSLGTSAWKSYIASAPNTQYRGRINDLNKILNPGGLGLGYRVVREMELYLANSAGLLPIDTAFDLQVKQRILPRVRGTSAISETLRSLITFVKNANLPRSLARLTEMQSRLERDGYTSFWR